MSIDDFTSNLIQQNRERLEGEYWVSVADQHPVGRPWALRKNSGHAPLSFYESSLDANEAKRAAIERDCDELAALICSPT